MDCDIRHLEITMVLSIIIESALNIAHTLST